MRRKLSKKGSIELSISFLVKLIISIVVFGLGMIIINSIFFSANVDTLSPGISDAIQSQIKILLDTGEKVTVFPEVANIKKNDQASFGIGVLNVLAESGTTEFNLYIECSEYIDGSGEAVGCPSELGRNPFTFPNFESINIKRNEADVFSVPMLMKDADPGTYVFNAQVTSTVGSSTSLYGIVKFIIKVK